MFWPCENDSGGSGLTVKFRVVDSALFNGRPLARRRLALYIVLLVLLGGFGPSDDPADDTLVVAEVADTRITAEDFRSRYVKYLVSTGLHDSRLARDRFLQRMIEDQLLAMDALEDGAASRTDYRIVAERYRRKLLIDLYVRRTLYDQIQVSEAELQEVFSRINTSVKARHLFAHTREEADLLYDRLMSGESFEALAAETFADSALAASGGSLGYFEFDEMDLAFEDAAFSMEIGEISRPVQTVQGYSIIQVEDRVTNPVLTENEFLQRRANLTTFVINRKRERARLKHIRSLASELDVQFEAEPLKDLHRQIAGTFVTPEAERYEEWLASPLLTYTNEGERRTWTVADFRDEAGLTDPEQRAQVRTPDDLRTFIEAVLSRSIMLARAENAQLDETPGFHEAFAQAMTDWLARVQRAELVEGVPDEQTGPVIHRHITALRERFGVQVSRETLASLPLRTDL